MKAIGYVLPAAVICGALNLAAAPPAGSFSGHIELVLWGSVFQGPSPEAQNRNAILHLRVQDGKWDRVLGYSLAYSNGMTYGLVEKAEQTDQQLTLTLNVVVNGDQWVRGVDRGAYVVTLKRDGPEKLNGTWEGTFKGHKLSGKATADVFPLQPLSADFKPVQPGEHPRILLRKHEIPALRQRLQTPLGRAYLAAAQQATDAYNLSMLHVLTGEQRYADQARRLIEPYVGDPDGAYLDLKGGGSGGAGHTLVATAIAYDMCYDAWPADFRAQVQDVLLAYIPRLTKYCIVTSHANPHPCSNYFGPGHGAPAIASLAIWGDKGAALEKPEDPAKAASIVLPPDDFVPGEGVPVLDLVPGAVPSRWLYAGPVPRKSKNDLLGAIGGYPRARPKLGTEVRSGVMVDDKVEMTALTFAKLPDETIKDGAIDLAKLAPATGPHTTIFYTVIQVKEKRIVVCSKNSSDTRIWLNDSELHNGVHYSLRPGLYPVILVHASDKPPQAISPRLDAAEAGAGAERAALYHLETAFQESYKAQCDAAGSTSSLAAQATELAWLRMHQHYRYGIGDGGYAAETGVYADIASHYPLLYNAYHRNVFGHEATFRPDVNLLVVRRMMQTIFLPGGKCRHETIGPTGGWHTAFVAAAFPTIPQEYKPGVLWAWNHVGGVKEGDPSTLAGLFGGKGETFGGGPVLVHTFLNYPLDMKAVHPSQSMPRNWEAREFGWYCFRNEWENDAVVAQIYLKNKPIGGWSIQGAGTFRLSGLGHEWVGGFHSKEMYRFEEGVLLLPDDNVDTGSCAHPTHVRFEKDGSGALTADMNDVYGVSAGEKKSKRAPATQAAAAKADDAPDIGPIRLYDRNALRIAQPTGGTLITGLRAFGFDYSGKSGAPLLMVIVDKVEGGKRRDWNWPCPEDGPERGPKVTPTIKADGNSFTIAYADKATLRATFISPQKVTIDPAAKARIDYERWPGKFVEYSRVSTTADGGSFFVVVTLQRGDAPPVKVDGAGLDAKVTVGGQTVRFDGNKVIFGG
jgi:hypothetical protein